MRHRRMWAAAAAAAIVGLGASGAGTPAQADCLYLTVYVSAQNRTPTYLHNGCVTDTPWKQRVTTTNGYTGTGHPDGTPTGYFVDARVPLPG